MRRPILCLAAIVAFTCAARAQTNSPGAPQISAAPTNQAPAFRAAQSPVSFFRQLLALSPPERNKLLASRPSQSRTRILAKVREYEALAPDDRELRLRATELRWYLVPLLNLAPADRGPKLAQVPPELLEIVKSRLNQWDLLPPPLKQEFLANDKTLHYLAGAAGPVASAQENKVTTQFSQFIALTPAEKEQLLGALSDAERAQMQKTLKAFDNLPEAQRLLCERNYAKFAGMSDSERAEFLKNAESWSQMSPEERQTWRDLVERVPIWPPMPPGLPIMPPMPTQLSSPAAGAGMATN